MGQGIFEKKVFVKNTSREAHVCRRLLGPSCGLVLGAWVAVCG